MMPISTSSPLMARPSMQRSQKLVGSCKTVSWSTGGFVGRSEYPGLIGFSRTRENTIHLHRSLRFTYNLRVFEHTLNSWKLQVALDVLS